MQECSFCSQVELIKLLLGEFSHTGSSHKSGINFDSFKMMTKSKRMMNSHIEIYVIHITCAGSWQ